MGIIFLVGDNLFIDGTPLNQASEYGDFRIHDKGHDAFWEELLRADAVPPMNTGNFPVAAWPTILGGVSSHSWPTSAS